MNNLTAFKPTTFTSIGDGDDGDRMVGGGSQESDLQCRGRGEWWWSRFQGLGLDYFNQTIGIDYDASYGFDTQPSNPYLIPIVEPGGALVILFWKFLYFVRLFSIVKIKRSPFMALWSRMAYILTKHIWGTFAIFCSIRVGAFWYELIVYRLLPSLINDQFHLQSSRKWSTD